MRNDDRRARNILCLLGIIPVTWLGLLLAPAMSGGLPEIMVQFPAAMNNPFHIVLCEDSLKTVLIFYVLMDWVSASFFPPGEITAEVKNMVLPDGAMSEP